MTQIGKDKDGFLKALWLKPLSILQLTQGLSLGLKRNKKLALAKVTYERKVDDEIENFQNRN